MARSFEPQLQFAKIHQIPQLKHISQDSFERDYFEAEVPVVVSNGAADWTFDQMSAVYGSELIFVPKLVDSKWKEQESLARIISMITGAGGDRFYVQHPLDEKWRDDFIRRLYCQRWFPNSDGAYLWIGGPESGGIGLHQDDGYRNLVIQIVGQKHCILIHPSQTHLIRATSLYKQATGSFPFQFDSYRSEVTSFPHTLTASEINWDAFPELRQVEAHVCTLRPGDCVYIPTSWFHLISNLSANFSMSLRWTNDGWRESRLVFQTLLDLVLTFLRQLPEAQRNAFSSRLAAELERRQYIQQHVILRGPVRPPHLFGWEPIRDELLTTLAKITETLSTSSMTNRLPRDLFEFLARSPDNAMKEGPNESDEFDLLLDPAMARNISGLPANDISGVADNLLRDVDSHMRSFARSTNEKLQHFISTRSIPLDVLRDFLGQQNNLSGGRTLDDLHKILMEAAKFN